MQPWRPATCGRSLAGLSAPTLIQQRERDSFERREEVQTYSLSP